MQFGPENDGIQLSFLDEGTNSEAISKFTKHVSSVKLNKNITLVEMPRDKYRNLEYDNVTIVIDAGDKAGIYPIIFEEGGEREIKNVASFAKEGEFILKLTQMDPNEFKRLKNMNLTFSDTINTELLNTVKKAVKSQPEFADKEVVYLDAMLFIKHINLDDEAGVQRIFKRCVNNAIAKMLEIVGKSMTTQLNSIIKDNDTVVISTAIIENGIRNTVSQLPMRADFKVSITAMDDNKGVYKPNAGKSSTYEIDSYGYIDFHINREPVPGTITIPGVATPTDHSVSPNIIMTSFNSRYRTLSDALLSIAVMSQQVYNNNWIGTYAQIIERDAAVAKKSRKETIGDLIPMMYEGTIKANPNVKATVKPIDLYKLDLSAKVTTLANLVAQNKIRVPYLSLLCPVYSDDGVLKVFSDAAAGDVKSREMIINTLSAMTNGYFPKDYSDPIFYDMGIMVPVGIYNDGSQNIRPIQDVDLLQVKSIDGEFYAQLHNRLTAPRVEVASDIQIECVVANAAGIGQGKVYLKSPRVTFTNNFLTAVNKALAAAGFKVTMGAAVTTVREEGYGQYIDIEPLKASFAEPTIQQSFGYQGFGGLGV